MIHPFESRLERLIAYWKNAGIRLSPGISQEQLQKLQADVNFNFEDSFCKYLLRANGFADYGSDEAWFCFWPQERIIEENADAPFREEIIWFADHSINLCTFGFHRADRKIYTCFEKMDNIIHVADSFIEFVDLYLSNPYLLIK